MSTFNNSYGFMSDAQRMQQWTCAICNNIYVVPSLARDCEDKHLVTGR